MPKTKSEAMILVQSWVDTYQMSKLDPTFEDESVFELLSDMALEHGQILDNVGHMRWFKNELVEFILSNEGMAA